jgi:hypothetical protein
MTARATISAVRNRPDTVAEMTKVLVMLIVVAVALYIATGCALRPDGSPARLSRRCR